MEPLFNWGINKTVPSSGTENERLNTALDTTGTVIGMMHTMEPTVTVSDLIKTLQRVKDRYGDMIVVLDTGTAIADMYPEIHVYRIDGTYAYGAILMAMTDEDRTRLQECIADRGF